MNHLVHFYSAKACFRRWAFILASVCACQFEGTEADVIAIEQLAGRLAETTCRWSSQCDCSSPSPTDCITRAQDRFDQLFEPALSTQLQFDPQCAAKLDHQWNSTACATPADLLAASKDPSGQTSCSLFHGQGLREESCDTVGNFDSCQQGLTCKLGVCIDPQRLENLEPSRTGDFRCLRPNTASTPHQPLICALHKELDPELFEPDQGPQFIGCDGEMHSVSGSAKIGDSISDWTLYNDQNNPWRLYDHCGMPIVLIAAAAWCPACRSETQIYEQLFQAYAESGLIVITLLGETESGQATNSQDAARWRQEHALTHTIVADPSFTIASRYFADSSGIRLPASLFLDSTGQIQAIGTHEVLTAVQGTFEVSHLPSSLSND